MSRADIERQRVEARAHRAAVEAGVRARELSPADSRRLEHLAPLARGRRPKPKRVLTLDIESKDGPSQRAGFTRPFLTGLYDGKRVQQWRNAEQVRDLHWTERHLAPGGCVDRMMRAMLREEYMGARIYAHYGGAFDFLFCVAWLARSKMYKWTITPQGPNILALRIELARGPRRKQPRGRRGKPKRRAQPTRKKRAHWTLVDSVRLLPMSLKEAAKVFGAEVQKQELPLGLPETDPRWEEYHEADLRSLYQSLEAVDAMLQRLGGEMTLTTPAAAMRLFQRRFLDRKLDRAKHERACRDGKCAGCAHAFVRRAYKGGRVEVFRMSWKSGGVKKRLFYYDINSSYPAAMLFPMPAGPVLVHEGPDLPRPLDHYFDAVESGDWVAFAECTVRVPEDAPLPPLPYHEPDTGKLLFPVGTFSGTWDLSELALVKEVGGEVLSVKRLYLYPAAPVFRAMIEELYPLRKGGDEGLAKLVKLLLNALYGKFGQKPERTEVVYLPPHKANVPPEGAVPAGGDVFGACVWYVPTVSDQPHILPQIAAHVTSLARERLWRGMNEVLKRGGNIYYLDTDSIVCDVELPSSKELGFLKREYECAHLRGEFVRPKVYRLWCACRDKGKCKWYQQTLKQKTRRRRHSVTMRGQKIVCKGVPGEVLDRESFARFLMGKPVFFRRFSKLRTLAKEGLRNPHMVKTHKCMVTGYDKRVVMPDGTTRPIVLSEAA